jgi:2-phospho-L-lactate/phosphoenolpyruvate guanylyltransferase
VSAVAIIPVKRFTDAKRRLGGEIGGREKRRLVRAMLADVLDALGGSSEVNRVLVVSDERDIPKTDTAWERVADEDSGSHSLAALRGIAAAMRGGAESVVLLPGDCPLLDPAELDAALRRSRSGRVGIVPDRHGSGTNALVLEPPDAIEPAFGEDSRPRHERLAKEAGAVPVIERLYSLTLDVDTPSDLAALRQFLDRSPSLAPRTAAVMPQRGGGG